MAMISADLSALALPAGFNYIGVFLTFGCNLNCTYCINDPGQAGERIVMGNSEMPAEFWAVGLSRLAPALTDDLPITLQGGEPTMFGRGAGLADILGGVDAKFDLLTNLALPSPSMQRCIGPHGERLRRSAPYPSIRVSYHPAEMDRVWTKGLETLIERCEALRAAGFTVDPDKRVSDVGIYLVAHPDNLPVLEEARRVAAGRISLEPKEFLGLEDGVLYGTYKYPFSTDLIVGGHGTKTLSAMCRTSELLIDPLGFVWPCHHHLYETWMRGGTREAFAMLREREFCFGGDAVRALPLKPIGHILDPAFTLEALATFRTCAHYGSCIGCDTKSKNNRLQSLEDAGQAHTSVEIRNIAFTSELLEKITQPQQEALARIGAIAAPACA
jgi:hypothetical protein